MRRILFSILFMGFTLWSAQAQEPINTGVANFLNITSDARGAGMGSAGVALTGNDEAIFYNGATSLLDENRTGGITYNYTPWMRDFDGGYAFHTAGGFYKLNERSAILAGYRYFNNPKTNITVNGQQGGAIRPKEMAFAVGYAYELFTDFALSGTFKYIRSDMGKVEGAKSANAIAFDLGALYKTAIKEMDGATWSVGVQVSNIGTKLKYLNKKESLPTMAKLGGAVDLPFSSLHRLIVTADVGYRIAPSDVESVNVSAGAEYILRENFMFRGGYHYGDKNKGDSSYGTAGLGTMLKGAHIDFSWLFAASDNPLRNTFWASFGYSF